MNFGHVNQDTTAPLTATEYSFLALNGLRRTLMPARRLRTVEVIHHYTAVEKIGYRGFRCWCGAELVLHYRTKAQVRDRARAAWIEEHNACPPPKRPGVQWYGDEESVCDEEGCV